MVSRSGFYAWIKRDESKRDTENRKLVTLIKQSYDISGGVYGAPRVYAELRANGYRYGKNRIANLMRIHGFRGCPRRRKYRFSRKDKAASYAPNIVKRQFNVEHPNALWASDITYIHTREGFLYLAVVMDLYSRKIVGWSMDENMSRHLVIDAMKMALTIRQPGQKLIHHSDRGAQYASDDYQALLKENGIQCSMNGNGKCFDNAVVESFFGALKRERIRKYRYLTRKEARLDIFDYIECFYNRKRRHGYLGNISPEEFELKRQLAN